MPPAVDDCSINNGMMFLDVSDATSRIGPRVRKTYQIHP